MPEVTELVRLPPAPRRRGRIDWDEVLDGRVWKLVCGVDFVNEDGKTVRSTARREGKTRGIEIETRSPVKEGRQVIVYVQANRGTVLGNSPGDEGARLQS
jgi:hypothetical protein